MKEEASGESEIKGGGEGGNHITSLHTCREVRRRSTKVADEWRIPARSLFNSARASNTLYVGVGETGRAGGRQSARNLQHRRRLLALGLLLPLLAFYVLPFSLSLSLSVA